MILLFLTTAAVCAAAWVSLHWLRVKSFWATRGVPHHSPHPIYGSLTFLQKANISLWMRQVYDQFKSPYVGVWLFWRPALIVNCPVLARNILVRDAANFRNRLLSSAPSDPIGSLNIFTTNDPLWSNVRRRLSPAFTSSKLKAIQLLMNTKAKELVKRFATESKKGRFHCRDIFNDYTSDIIGTASLAVKSDATLTGNSAIRKVTKDFERFSYMRALAWTCIFFFPELVGPFRFTFFPKNATDYFREVFDAAVKQRQAPSNDKSEPRDLLDILLKMKNEMTPDNNTITDEVIISQAAIFIQGGFDTTGSLLTFITYELAHQPEIQENLYNELKLAKDENGGDDFDERTLSNVTYLNCVIKEALRKYQPMGWLDRISSHDYKIDDKLTIPAGTPLYVNSIGMCYDPEYYPDPTSFNPDRFLPENETDKIRTTFLAFGDGPRSCIGQRFAYATIRTAVSEIVLNYELRPFPNTAKPTDILIDKYAFFISPGENIYVQFIPRKSV